MVWVFRTGMLLLMLVFISYPIWRISAAIVYRFTKDDNRPLLVNLTFILVMGVLAAVWGGEHSSMFADIPGQPAWIEQGLFIILVGSAVLAFVHLVGSIIFLAYERLLVAIRGD